MTTRVGVVGSGTIGKRIADAVAKQDDMQLIGLAVRSPSSAVIPLLWHGHRLFGLSDSSATLLAKAGIDTGGTLDDLMGRCDVIIDCSPGKTATGRLPEYRARNILAICQGGEHHEPFGFTFNSLVNFKNAAGRTTARVGSCNTTGLSRLLRTLDGSFGVASVKAVLLRCATDPNKAHKGIVNGAVISLGMSHHAEDLKRMFPHVTIETQAVAVPMTHGHVANLFIRLGDAATGDAVEGILRSTPRIEVDTTGPTVATNIVTAAAGTAGRARSDRPELVVWRDGIIADGRNLMLQAFIHMEAIVVPENIDCIRALGGRTFCSGSLRKTDESLGIPRDGKAYSAFD
ncbi:type II glyceraldehyde-3-phosphate dehydrogenase [Bradyrhizobium japonicum]|uniref:type II glyceraldehyde-3-phosphate dehydrogenase n=1 Tax=Bradyrhizobium japonicum TaxID=375 RepID=UPI00200BAB01|nr:type II glyceraldehyde-3-phosphate dehydrogenase [Bradyrhizobium japonicum]UQE03629.1 type II glyceraldehyde-3-phosphate dehydrogenase [Bradyrhizobium japonicum]